MLTICFTDISIRYKAARPNRIDFRQYWLKPVGAIVGLVVLFFSSLTLSTVAINQAQVLASKDTNAASQSVRYDMTIEQLTQLINYKAPLNSPQAGLGMYHPEVARPYTRTPHIQHSFVDWRDEHYVAFVLASSLQAGNTPLITIEPRGESDGQKLLQDILNGAYDQRLDKLARVLNTSKNPVYIRFAHEMDLANLYPWGNQEPQLFIYAYRYVASKLVARDNQVKTVWSPAGNDGAQNYYPGDSYVDVIGTTILQDAYWHGNRLPSFKRLSVQRQWLQQYNKPVWIVEFGAGKANRSHQNALIIDAITSYESLGFEALIYLDLVDANIVGPDYSLPSIHDFGDLFVRKSERECIKPSYGNKTIELLSPAKDPMPTVCS